MPDGLLLLCAYLLDLAVGDPDWFPHPVRGIGRLIQGGERVTRRWWRNERLAGALTVVWVVSVTGLVVWGSLRAAAWAGAGWYDAVAVGWLYLGLSTRSLSDHVRQVARDLRAGDLPAARRSVARIVGRDTAALDASGVSRAAIESVAESAVDGVVAPLFFAALGGAPLLWIFKAVSTCDSMIGYKDARYRRFGTVGARADDVLNFVPARLALCLFPLAALLTGASARGAWHIAWRDRRHHASPNAGIPEAAMAGALHVRLGGPASYGGEMEDKPYFGAEFEPPQPRDVARAIRVMWIVSLLALGVAVGLAWVTGRFAMIG